MIIPNSRYLVVVLYNSYGVDGKGDRKLRLGICRTGTKKSRFRIRKRLLKSIDISTYALITHTLTVAVTSG